MLTHTFTKRIGDETNHNNSNNNNNTIINT